MAPPCAPVPHLTARAAHRKPRTRLGRIAEAAAAALLAPFIMFAMFAWMLGRLAAAMPGVEVTTETAPGGGDLETGQAGHYFVAGLTERGDTDAPVVIRSMTEYGRRLGTRVAYGTLYDDLATFFAEGGTRAYVARIVGDAATVGTLTLVDRAGVPVNTLRIDARDPGAWSADVTIEVTDGIVADTFNILVRYGGTLVEAYNNIASPADAVTQLAASSYVTATDLGSATAAPNNNPAVVAATALSAGTDDRASVVAADYTAALARFGTDLGSGAVAIPGQAAATVGAGIIAHARTHRRLALLAPASGQTVEQAAAAALALRNTAGAEHAGLFYPWVQVPDGAGGVRTVSPEGYVAGVRARTIAAVGPWRAPAGDIARSRYITGVELELTEAEIDSLTDDHVNTIRTGFSTVRLYGWRSLSTDAVNYRFLNGRDVLNDVAARLDRELELYVFRTIDGRGALFTEVEGTIASVLQPIAAAGGLYAKTDAEGNEVDPGYRIDTGPTVNTPETVAAGEVRAAVALRVSPVGELIRVTISKVSLRSEL